MGIQEAGSRDFQEPLGVQLELRFGWSMGLSGCSSWLQ